jgi:hypothetical protein
MSDMAHDYQYMLHRQQYHQLKLKHSTSSSTNSGGIVDKDPHLKLLAPPSAWVNDSCDMLLRTNLLDCCNDSWPRKGGGGGGRGGADFKPVIYHLPLVTASSILQQTPCPPLLSPVVPFNCCQRSRPFYFIPTANQVTPKYLHTPLHF